MESFQSIFNLRADNFCFVEINEKRRQLNGEII